MRQRGADPIVRVLAELAALALLAALGYTLLQACTRVGADGRLGLAVGLGVLGLLAMLGAAVMTARRLSGAAAESVASIIFPATACEGHERVQFRQTLNTLIREDRFEAAIELCKHTATARPDDAEPYVRMMEIAAYGLRDRTRLNALHRRGQMLLRSERARAELDSMYVFVSGGPMAEEAAGPARRRFGALFEDRPDAVWSRH